MTVIDSETHNKALAVSDASGLDIKYCVELVKRNTGDVCKAVDEALNEVDEAFGNVKNC